MRHVCLHKAKVPVSFGGYYYPIYSLVIVHEKGKNVLGRIVGYHGLHKVIVKTKTGHLHEIKYSDVIFYEDPHQPEMTLSEFQRTSNKVIDKYRKTPVTIDGKDYIIDFKVVFVYDTEYVGNTTTSLAAVCNIGYSSMHQFEIKVPYLQWADRKQINEIILHEVAHLLADPGEQHGPIWKAIYLAMGGNGEELIDAADVTLANLESIELPEDWRTIIHKVDLKYWEQLSKLLQQHKTGFRLFVDIVGIAPVFYGMGHYERVIPKFIHGIQNLHKYKLKDIKEDITDILRLAQYFEVYIDRLEEDYNLDDDSVDPHERIHNNTYTTFKQARQLRRAKGSLKKFVNLLEKRFIKLVN